MAMIPPQQVQLNCQNCGTPFVAPVWSFIDVGAQPELKNALLSGQLNVAVCPNCGAGGMLATPLMYHDPAKKLLLTLLPQELNLKPEDQERFVGELSRAIMDSLPADAPRGYVLTPRRFISMTSLIEAVLEADGIPPEVFKAQRARVELLSRLAEAMEADRAADQLETPQSKLAQIVAQNTDGLNYDFFLTLASYIDAATQQGRADSATMLTELRDRLLELSDFDAVQAGLQEPDIDSVIAALQAADVETLENTIADYRPSIDDDLFDRWEQHIDDMDATEAGAARDRLQLVRTTVERMDAEAQALFEGAANLLRSVLQADDPQAVLRERAAEINEAFLIVIDANMAAAARGGQQDVAQQLMQVRDWTLAVLQERMTPQERLINQLLTAESAGDATKLLRKNVGVVDQAFITQVNEMAAEMDQQGRKEFVDRLRQVAREAASLLF